MIDFFLIYLTNSINITFFILLFLLLEPILKKHYSSVCLYRICVILLIGLFIPFRIGITEPLFHIRSPRISVSDKASKDFDTIYADHYNDTTVKYHTLPKQFTNKNNKASTYNQMFATNLYVIYRYRYVLISFIWLIGVICFLISNCIKYYKYKKQIVRYITTIHEANIRNELDYCIEEIEWYYNKRFIRNSLSSRKPHIYHCAIIQVPMSIGIRKPVILIPNESYSKKDLHFLLHHELIHIWRMDAYIKLFHLIVLSLNWFNPLCYIFSKHFDHWCEASCDELVLYHSSPADRMDYSKLLLSCATTQTVIKKTLISNFYGGKDFMKQRLISIMNQKKKYSGKIFLVLSLAIISSTVFITSNHNNTFASSNNTMISKDSDIIKSTENDRNKNNSGDITTPKSNKESTPAVLNKTQNDNHDINMIKNTNAGLSRDTIVQYAKQSINTPYKWGGNDLNTGVDCSGFVQAIYKKLGYNLPRLSKDQLKSSKEVSIDNLLPGDLVFYKSKDYDTISHVGIYIGDNQIIHAKNLKDNVIISDINYRPPYCGGRIITD